MSIKSKLVTIVSIATLSSVAALLSGCATVSEVAQTTTRTAKAASAAIAAPRIYDADVFFDTTDYSIAGIPDGAYSPDGKTLLISSNATGVFNAYALNLETGEQQALTSSETNANFAGSFFPDGERILFVADGGGDELTHVFVREADGTIKDLTPGDKEKASLLSWIDGGKSLLILSNRRDARFFDLYQVDTQTYKSKMVFQNDLALEGISVSTDGKILAGTKQRTSADSDIYVVNLGTEDATPNLITEHKGNIAHNVLTFTPEGDQLVYATDEFGEFSRAMAYDLASGETRTLIEEDWDISYVTYSPSGKYRVSAINADGSTQVTIAKRNYKNTEKTTSSGTVKEVELRLKNLNLPDGLPEGDLRQVRFSPDEETVSFAINASNSPSNIFAVNLADNSFRQYTQALSENMNPDDLVTSTVERFESFDGLTVPGILYKPKTASAETPVPALVWVHGGPGGQSRTGYSAAIQHLVNNGYAVFAANNRGSSGYGKTFFHLDDKMHGEGDLQDIVSAKNHLAAKDWIDADRIGIIGGSYGGFMVVAALAFEPEEFEVGIDIFGVTNWVRTLKSIPPWWESFRESLYDEMGDPATDEERHRRISPLFHAENIVKPLLVVQGSNDPRVLQVESDEMVEAVRANGIPVEYIVFPDEGHGFLKRENRIAASQAYVKFLNTYLKGN